MSSATALELPDGSLGQAPDPEDLKPEDFEEGEALVEVFVIQ
jgi:hypothetical protein